MTSEATYASQALEVWKHQIESLRQGKQIFATGDDEVLRPKIQRAPQFMKAREEFGKFYLPKLISFGPIHFLEPYVQQGMRYKFKWTQVFLENTNQTWDSLIERIRENCLGELEQLFAPNCWTLLDDDTTTGGMHRVETQLQVLTMDGCSLLQVLEHSFLYYFWEDGDLNVSFDKVELVFHDMNLLENQIPYKVLKLLCNDDKARLERCTRNFLLFHGIEDASGASIDGEVMPEHTVIVQEEGASEPTHLLDYLRRALLMRDTKQIAKEIVTSRKLNLKKSRIGNIRELKAAGIRVMKDPNSKIHFYPSFIAGRLLLPHITVDEVATVIYLNLMAYEMCPDFDNNFEISSYFVFLSSLIDQPEDVKELTHAGILDHDRGSDKEVVDLFNSMDFGMVPETQWMAEIRSDIRAHFESKRGRIKVLGWLRDAYRTYFRSPWTVIALLAAALGLVLTFIQTWFAIHPQRGS